MIQFLRSGYHFLLAWLGSIFYRWPSQQIFVLGVTGTKGKTTVLELIAFILERAGKKVVVSSSLRHSDSAMTMPGRFYLQRFLRQAVRAGCDYALIEVTSEGIIQHRHRHIQWDAVMFLNLAPEHIEAHGSFENYRRAKIDFFRYLANKESHLLSDGRQIEDKKLFFINQDDASAELFKEAARGGQVILYGASDLRSGLWGVFNQYNIGAAVAFCQSQGIGEEVIKKAVAEFPGIPGRMEFVQQEPFTVVIDYAHTPDSLLKVYETLRQAQGKLICVFGSAGGGRDKWKRPELGKIAAEFCNEIILTNEDPYDEPPEDIILQIENGLLNSKNYKLKTINYYKIIDRREAVKKALELARAGDTVIITGKGSEKWIHLVNGQRIPWSDKQTVLELLK